MKASISFDFKEMKEHIKFGKKDIRKNPDRDGWIFQGTSGDADQLCGWLCTFCGF